MMEGIAFLKGQFTQQGKSSSGNMHLKAGEKLKAGRGRVALEGRARDESSSSNHGKDNHDKGSG